MGLMKYLIKFIENRSDVIGIEDIYEPNPNSDPNSSDNPRKAVISLQNHDETSYGRYIEVQNILRASYTEIRDKESKKRFGVNFNELNSDNQDIIKEYYPMKISEAEPRE